jgi:hypothetical protein
MSDNIYIVSSWGNPQEGPDGKDRIFLVSGSTPEEASHTVDNYLAKENEGNVPFRSNWIALLGAAYPNASFSGIILGPFLDLSPFEHHTRVWVREVWEDEWTIRV